MKFAYKGTIRIRYKNIKKFIIAILFMLIYNNLCIKMIHFAGIAQLVEQLTCNQ